MKPWKQHVLVSVAGVVGSCVALFLIPEETLVWHWTVVSLGVIALLNYGVYRRRGRPPVNGREDLAHAAIIAFAFLLLILDVLWSRYLRGMR